MKALLFDIRRFSTHDGDGLRTTFFFKGCPLRCAWCQNPEGIPYTPDLLYLKNQCIGCGRCASVSKGNVKMENGFPIFLKNEAVAQLEKYIDICPAAALRMDSTYYSVDELVQEALKDKIFYRQNGGVTFSGGEPLAQAGFLQALLPALQKEGIHTAIETALAVPWEKAEPVLEKLDLIYADCKIFDSQIHQRYVGVDNAQILKNISTLLTSSLKNKVIIRVPLIPGVTATPENLKQIAHFLHALYPNVQVELLNYNPLAASKYINLPQAYLFNKENPAPFSEEELQNFCSIFKQKEILKIQYA